ncbi:MAG: hypothetical protein ACE5JL_13670, partial [Dehalococcoidia bacterium]
RADLGPQKTAPLTIEVDKTGKYLIITVPVFLHFRFSGSRAGAIPTSRTEMLCRNDLEMKQSLSLNQLGIVFHLEKGGEREKKPKPPLKRNQK